MIYLYFCSTESSDFPTAYDKRLAVANKKVSEKLNIAAVGGTINGFSHVSI
jgi:hypothetical protein